MILLQEILKKMEERGWLKRTRSKEDERIVRITLTDEDDIPDGQRKLMTIYHRLTDRCYDNKRTRHEAVVSGAEDVERKSPLELFSEFYLQQNGVEMSEEQTAFVRQLIEKIWEDEQ